MECLVQGRCGGCKLLGTDYREQLEMKRDEVVASFASFDLKPCVHDVVGMDSPLNYRNKIIAAVSMHAGKTVLGLYEEDSHRVVPYSQCLLQDSCLNGILLDIQMELNKLEIRPSGFGGVLKHVLLRIGHRTGQVMVVFVTSADMFHGRGELVKRLAAKHPEIRTFIQNVNPRRTSIVLGDREMTLYGTGFIHDELLGHRFKISAKSFYQINPVQTERLYAKALELASISSDDMVFDAYCGIGTIGISASDKASSVLGVEINSDAVRDARANARANGIRNTDFICADVSDFMREFRESPDVLILDPPRSGCDRRFLESVLKMSPGRIVYISCDPHTQARDIAFLKKRYSYGDAYPFDMFPHTPHIENIVPLERRPRGLFFQ